MPKGYRSYLPEQDLPLPPSLRDWLPERHLAYYLSDVVEQLDLSAIHAVYEKEMRGQPPYDPRMMRKALVYGYCVGVFSSRRIRKRLLVNIGCYQHACLLWVSGRRMTNASLRGRLGIADQNYSMASRVISETIQQRPIQPSDPGSTSRKRASYVPFWA